MITLMNEEQRKLRLHESIDEYLNDGEVDVDLFYKDLREGIQSLIDFHDKMKQRAQEGMDAILGHRPIPELDQIPGLPKGNRL
jgi:soluble cytochrome b562